MMKAILSSVSHLTRNNISSSRVVQLSLLHKSSSFLPRSLHVVATTKLSPTCPRQTPCAAVWSASPISLLPQIPIRTKMTKARRHKRAKIKERERRVALGLRAKPLPPKYIPKDTPVIGAKTRVERDAESAEFDVAASLQMKVKMEEQTQREESLRFDFDGLTMSDRVRKLLKLTNGSQREVVATQKRKGMELFQLREGDTGSSAVQVVALTTRIQQMQTHLAKHKKDFSGKRGLDALYVRRRKILDYVERKDFESYRKVVKSLGLARK